MKAFSKLLLATSLSATLSLALMNSYAADADHDNATREFMKKYHKAPQGTDTISKKATLGKASPEELKALAAGYRSMSKAKPPQGEMGSWKEKTTKIATAADALVKGDPDAVARYKEAANCKACHDIHKPKQ